MCCCLVGYGSVISLMANMWGDFLGLSSQFTGWQRREPASSETADDGPSDLLRLISCGDLMGLRFALQVVLFLKAYSLVLSSACICVLPIHSDRLTLQKRASPTWFKSKTVLENDPMTEFHATASNFQQNKICWSQIWLVGMVRTFSLSQFWSF